MIHWHLLGSGEVHNNDGDSDFVTPFGMIGRRTVFGAMCLLLLAVIIIFIISSLIALWVGTSYVVFWIVLCVFLLYRRSRCKKNKVKRIKPQKVHPRRWMKLRRRQNHYYCVHPFSFIKHASNYVSFSHFSLLTLILCMPTINLLKRRAPWSRFSASAYTSSGLSSLVCKYLACNSLKLLFFYSSWMLYGVCRC